MRQPLGVSGTPTGDSSRLGNVIQAWYFGGAIPNGAEQDRFLVDLLCQSRPSLAKYVGTQQGRRTIDERLVTAKMTSAEEGERSMRPANVWHKMDMYSYAGLKVMMPEMRVDLRRVLQEYSQTYDPSLMSQTYVGGDSHVVVHYRVGDMLLAAERESVISPASVARAVAELQPSVVELLDGGTQHLDFGGRAAGEGDEARAATKCASEAAVGCGELGIMTNSSVEFTQLLVDAIAAAAPGATVVRSPKRSVDADLYRMVHAPMLVTGIGSYAIAGAVAGYAKAIRTPAAWDLMKPEFGMRHSQALAENWQTYPYEMLKIRQKTASNGRSRVAARAAAPVDSAAATLMMTKASILVGSNSWSSWTSKYAVLHSSARAALESGHLGSRNDLAERVVGPGVASSLTVKALVFMVREGEWGGPGVNATRGFSGGFADRITGLISMFALCIATNTAFFVDWPGLDEVFEIGSGGLRVLVDASRLQRNHGLVEVPVRQGEWKVAALERKLRSSPITIVRSDHGALGRAFEASSSPMNGRFGTYRRMGLALRDIGLDLETAFPRLLGHLFAPSKQLREAFATEAQVLSNPKAHKIMVQIRTGDRVLQQIPGDNMLHPPIILPAHRRFFECAEEVARGSAGGAAADTIIYLMTDSAQVREYARARYAHKRMKLLLPPASSRPALFHSYARQGLLSVAGETWLGTLCDYFVVSLTSGLGFQAAFRSGRGEGRLHVLQNEKDNNAGTEELLLGMNTSCWPAVPLVAAAQTWSEI